jgi:hypothetical protein
MITTQPKALADAHGECRCMDEEAHPEARRTPHDSDKRRMASTGDSGGKLPTSHGWGISPFWRDRFAP